MMELATLQSLELAILDHQQEDVRAFFEAADLSSGNDALFQAGQEYRFQTYINAEPPINGHAIMLARDLAKLMYGKEDTSHPGHLLKQYGFDFVRLEGCGPEIQTLLRDHFHLSKFDGKAAFATWQHFLVVGMYGQTEQARKVKAYLLKREKASRIADKVEESTGMSPRQLAVASSGDLLVQMAEAYREQERRLLAVEAADRERQAALIEIQMQTIEALRRTRAIEVKTETQEVETAALAAQHERLSAQTQQNTSAIQRITEEEDRQTIEEYVVGNRLKPKMPERLWGAYGKHLQKYCRDQGIALGPPVPVEGRPWKTETEYPLSVFRDTFASWLFSINGQMHLE
jgi:hypothetical protein